MSQQPVEGIQQYGKLYSDENDKLHISFPKKIFFQHLSVFACLGLFAAFASDGAYYTPASLSLRMVMGLANLVLVGLIGVGIGLYVGSPITLIAAGICALIGLVCDLYAANRTVQMNVWAVNLKTGQYFNYIMGKSVPERIKNGEIQIVPITEEIASHLKQHGVED